MAGRQDVTDRAEPPVSVDALMRRLEGDLRNQLRRQLLDRGGAREYTDDELFAAVERVLRHAVEARAREHDALLLPALMSDENEWELQTHLRFSSHRPILGNLIVFLKRRVLLPVTRWLYEYSLENFRRQQRINRVLFACLEELAIENARLRQDLERLADKS
jgi:hypothetical protein